MKREKLLKAIGEIDDQFIVEADIEASVRLSARGHRRRMVAIAASFAVVVLAGVLAIKGNLFSAGKMGSFKSSGQNLYEAANTDDAASSEVANTEKIVFSSNAAATSNSAGEVTVNAEYNMPEPAGAFQTDSSAIQVPEAWFDVKNSSIFAGDMEPVIPELTGLYIPAQGKGLAAGVPRLGIPGLLWTMVIAENQP